MKTKKYLAIAILLLTLITSCETSTITSNAIIQTPQQTIEEIIGPPQTEENQISIGTFNIQIFGKAKREKEEVMKKIADIAEDYDIIAIQEIRDKEKKTATYFLEKINSRQGNNYSMIESERVGRTTAKEQYAFYYNNEKIEYLNVSYIYPDKQDNFEREPHIAYFKAKNGNFDFILVNIHTKPTEATKEINSLTEVIDYILEKHPNEKDVIITGDLNADGTYYKENDKKNPLNNEKYYWAIPNHFDTTIAKTRNTYDRIIFLQENTLTDYAYKSGVDRFENRWPEITETEKKAISDHYPAWAIFYTDRDRD